IANWPCLNLLSLLPLLFGIAFHLQLVLLSYHPIFLRPYHFLKLVSFRGANRTKSASVCLWLLKGKKKILKKKKKQHNTLHLLTQNNEEIPVEPSYDYPWHLR